jgi:hypothetical protein
MFSVCIILSTVLNPEINLRKNILITTGRELNLTVTVYEQNIVMDYFKNSHTKEAREKGRY